MSVAYSDVFRTSRLPEKIAEQRREKNVNSWMISKRKGDRNNMAPRISEKFLIQKEANDFPPGHHKRKKEID